ncbi:MAG: efflux RND transporter permease subunit [Elusimicrobia bacterium]|nr:efflux RND transporter permease subunit [Elusimicrobiota bacterium]
MNISELSIRNPVFAWMLMAAMMLFGWIGFSRMGVSLNPDVDFPVVTVSLAWDGAAPEIMETEIVDIIEDAITTVEGVKEITSSSRQGAASVTVEMGLDRNVDVAVQEIQSKLLQAQRRLPQEMDPPIVTKSNPEDQPIMWLGLYGDRPVRDLMIEARDHVKQAFQTIPGVGEVFLGGFQDRALRVWLDSDKLAAKELTVQDVIAAIGRQHHEVPAGQLETATKEFNVRTYGEIVSPEAFGDLLITHRGGAPIHVPIPLKMVARIEDGLADFRRITRVNGQRAVGLGLRKQRGANAVAVAKAARERMVEVEKRLPQGMHLGVNFDSTRYIEESVKELNHHMVLAAVLTGIVCWLFLGSWSSTLNVLIAIPTSVLGTFIVAYFLGFTLNTFTMLGLTLSIGIVVDDAIMVLENIVRHGEAGAGKEEAARSGTLEIQSAAVASTIAILAIFIPVVFMQGIIGKFFFQYGITISTAVALSLLEALTLTPSRCAQFLAVRHDKGKLLQTVDAGFDALSDAYKRSLHWCLDRRWTTIGLAFAVFGLSLFLARDLKREMSPHQDQSIFMLRFETPVGTSLDATDGMVKPLEAWLKENPAVRRYLSAIGGFGGGEVNTGLFFVTMKDRKDRPKDKDGNTLTQLAFMNEVREKVKASPPVRGFVMDMSQQGFSSGRGFPIEFTVRGPDWEKLVELSSTLRKRLEDAPLLQDVNTDYKTGMPELRILPDRSKAYRRGVAVDVIGQTINAMVGGVRAGWFTEGGHRYEVRARGEEKFRLTPEDIGRYYVRNTHGELTRLSDVTRMEERTTLLTITRKDRERAIGLMANVATGASQADALSEVERIAKEVLPEGYRMVWSGSSQSFKESFRSLMFAMVLGIIVAYMVLGAQFNSFIHPVTVLLALPFSISGALLALRIGGMSINVYSMIGLILLMGIVKKNSILLVDFANQRREGGLSPEAAMLEAGPVRLRPIIMTSVATVAAAIPSALAWGAGSETSRPMAASVIGGVLLSTVLTLLVVPCAYSLFAKLESKTK